MRAGDGVRLPTTDHEGFHGRAGFGRRPALVVVDVNRGFTDPASPLVCDLDGVVDAIGRLLDGFRAAGLPVAFTTVAYDEAGKQAAAVFIDKVPALLALEAGQRLDGDRPADRPARGRAGADEAAGRRPSTARRSRAS